MALIKCPDCENKISSRALQCPFCGCPADFFDDASTIETDDGVDRTTDFDVNEVTAAKEVSVAQEVLHSSSDTSSVDSPSEMIETPRKGAPDNYYTHIGIYFGNESETHPDHNKYPFNVIRDPSRESDDFKDGTTHVVFRLGDEHYLRVKKDNLFYADFIYEINDRVTDNKKLFATYLSSADSLYDLLTGASNKANTLMAELIQYFVDKLVDFQIYDYNIQNLSSRCDSSIYLDNSSEYKNILSKIESIERYESSLSHQRSIERSSRSQWTGGGFGVKGAIKGAVTAAAFNAATDAVRGIGDSFTDASDKSDVQAKYDAIVNTSNKESLLSAFEKCCYSAERTFLRVLESKTGWSADGVLLNNYNECRAKLENIDKIIEEDKKEAILRDLLENYGFDYNVIRYALSNALSYPYSITDLLHYIKRLHPVAYKDWMSESFYDSINRYASEYRADGKVQFIIDYGKLFEVIDDNLVPVDDFGFDIVFCVLAAEMETRGLSLKNADTYLSSIPYAMKESYFQSLHEIGVKYHILTSRVIKPYPEAKYSTNKRFTELLDYMQNEYDKCCTVRSIKCESIQAAEILSSEWNDYDRIYNKGHSYADFDSSTMSEIISSLEAENFRSTHLHCLIDGTNGLKERLQVLEQHEKTDAYKQGKAFLSALGEVNVDGFYYYGSEGFVEKAFKVLALPNITKTEIDPFPVAIYDDGNEGNFKGFVLTDTNFYNFNSLLGIGFGDKVVTLNDIIKSSYNGKSRVLGLKNGKNVKLKVLGPENVIFDALSNVYSWETAQSLTHEVPALLKHEIINNNNVEPLERPTLSLNTIFCMGCGQQMPRSNKFCTFCGEKNQYYIDPQDMNSAKGEDENDINEVDSISLENSNNENNSEDYDSHNQTFIHEALEENSADI